MRKRGSRRGRNEVSVELFRKESVIVEIAANFPMTSRYVFGRISYTALNLWFT